MDRETKEQNQVRKQLFRNSMFNLVIGFAALSIVYGTYVFGASHRMLNIANWSTYSIVPEATTTLVPAATASAGRMQIAATPSPSPAVLLEARRLAAIEKRLDQLSKFGDFVGGSVGPLLGFASTVLLILTLYYQRKQMDQQASTEARSRFENTFFKLIDAQNNIVSNLVVSPPEWVELSNHTDNHPMFSEARGSQCFKVLYQELRSIYSQHDRGEKRGTCQYDPKGRPPLGVEAPSLGEFVDFIAWSFSELQRNYSDLLSHYFRNLYNLVKFIDDSDLTLADKLFYINIAKAQLSTYELLLLKYNSFSVHGYKFAAYIERYSLLDNIRIQELLNKNHLFLYKRTAFGQARGIGQFKVEQFIGTGFEDRFKE